MPQTTAVRERWRSRTSFASGGTTRTTRRTAACSFTQHVAMVVEAGYRSRGGKDPDLPGSGAVSGPGRVDLRLATDRSGELYLLSKSDGMIRVVTGIAPVVTGRQPR